MHFLNTPSVLDVSYLRSAQFAFAKRYAHWWFVANGACRSGGVQNHGTCVPTQHRDHSFLTSAPSVGMRILEFVDTSNAGRVVFAMKKSNCTRKSVALAWVWRAAISKITRAAKLMNFYSVSHAILKAWDECLQNHSRR